jgi:hypothetical protein
MEKYMPMEAAAAVAIVMEVTTIQGVAEEVFFPQELQRQRHLVMQSFLEEVDHLLPLILNLIIQDLEERAPIILTVVRPLQEEAEAQEKMA